MNINLGAVPNSKGVLFRTWAPFADWVSVVGTFNDWQNDAHRLVAVADGCWELLVPEAEIGHEYKFVLRHSSHYRIDPWARTVTNSAGNGVITDSNYEWSSDRFSMSPWHELVIYELHFGSRLRAGVPLDDLFADAAALIDDLVDLGVNAVEIMPVGEFAGDVSWGYNPSNIFAVESSYGGPNALKRFVDLAHSAGIAVLMDVVYNHLGPRGIEHSVWRYDGWYENAGGGIYFYNDWRANTHGAGVGEWNRPDYGRPEVRHYLVENARMWLEDFRLDGLRLDLTCYIRNVEGKDDDPPEHPRNLAGNGWRLLTEINDMARNSAPWKLIVAEDMRDNARITLPTKHKGAGFGSQWHPEFHHTLRSLMTESLDEHRDMYRLQRAIEWKFNGDACQRVIYTENHDEVGDVMGDPFGDQRVPTHIDRREPEGLYAQKRSTLGAAVLFSSPGIPLIFMGQEMLEIQQFQGVDSIDWSRRDRFPGIVRLYHDLIHLRRNLNGNTSGLRGHYVHVFHVNPNDHVIAYLRGEHGGPRDDVIVAANWSNRAFTHYRIGVPRNGLWRVRFNSDAKRYSPLFDGHSSLDADADPIPLHGFPWSIEIGLGRYSAVFLSQDS